LIFLKTPIETVTAWGDKSLLALWSDCRSRWPEEWELWVWHSPPNQVCFGVVQPVSCNLFCCPGIFWVDAFLHFPNWKSTTWGVYRDFLRLICFVGFLKQIQVVVT
jgi:hypothetical protein